MDAPARNPDEADRPVTAHHPSPDRTVFTETGNRDRWIATDTVVDLER
ncbi:hypothetical protein [Halomarina litorea]|nr:hypothetical protein [Halomarina sp. BCD28]